MRRAIFLLTLLLFSTLLSCRKHIPDPPVGSQRAGVPVSSGPCTISFYSLLGSRTYDIRVDGVYLNNLTGSAFVPSCGSSATAIYHLQAGTHNFSATWTDPTGSGGLSGTFTLHDGDCLLYELQ